MASFQTQPLVPVCLVRVVLREDSDQQWIFLEEEDAGPGGARGFPIVIGTSEANEIHRVLTDTATTRPMTHQLMAATIGALGSRLIGVDIVDLRANTFYAQLRLTVPPGGDGAGLTGDSQEEILVDARPSDALALALRVGATIRVAESVLEQVRTDQSTDTLPHPDGSPKGPTGGLPDPLHDSLPGSLPGGTAPGFPIGGLHDESAMLFDEDPADAEDDPGQHPGDGSDSDPSDPPADDDDGSHGA